VEIFRKAKAILPGPGVRPRFPVRFSFAHSPNLPAPSKNQSRVSPFKRPFPAQTAYLQLIPEK
jgi:hypothetical protein